MHPITTCLWFNENAEQAVQYYASVFTNVKVGAIARYGDEGANVSGRPKGSAMTVEFEIAGMKFLALNGGPHYQFSPATSFMIHCDTQEEIDHYWEKLGDGGVLQQCGWLTDKFGVTWQVLPTALSNLMKDPDAAKVERVMHAMLQMKKLDIAALKRAYAES